MTEVSFTAKVDLIIGGRACPPSLHARLARGETAEPGRARHGHGDTGARGGPRAGGEGRGRLAQPQASIVFGRPSSVPRIRVQGIKQNTTGRDEDRRGKHAKDERR